MREIKFRAWDKVSKKFLHPWPNGFHILGETTCFDLIGMQLKERSPEKTTLEMLNDVVLMQFTGLHDKNGKEIWEGDIVRREVCSPDDMAHGAYGYTGIVKWERGKFVIECDEDFSFYDCMGDLFSWNELEVIGNISENKELLS